MPQGNYDARESGNYKIVNGKRVPLPPRSSNDARSGGERGPKGSSTYTRQDTSSGQGMRDMFGVPFAPNPQERPISSIATSVAARDQRLFDLGRSRPQVERAGSIKAWNYDTVKDMPVKNNPTSRPYGKEGKSSHPDFRASSVNTGAEEAATARRNIDRAGRRQGFTSQELRQYTGPLNQVAGQLRAAGRQYENEYTDKYLSTQTQRMRDMMDTRKPKTDTRKPSDTRWDGPAPASDHLDVAPNDDHRGGSTRTVGKDFMPSDGRVAKAVRGAARGAAVNGALRAGGLAAGAFVAGRAMEHGERSAPQKTESQKMRDDASDMGPVKGRVMERRSYQAASGTRPQDTKIVPYEGQGPISRKLGVSNVKAGNNK